VSSAVLNPPGSHKVERFHGGTCFRVGDKVLQLRNNYDKEVFNGDSGTITVTSLEEQTVTVRLDDERRVSYEFSELDEWMLAYALSIHNALGSEYPVYVIPLAMEQYLLLERQLVYTAVTRARQLVVLVGSKRALTLAVRNGPTSVVVTNTLLDMTPRCTRWRPRCPEAGRAAPLGLPSVCANWQETASAEVSSQVCSIPSGRAGVQFHHSIPRAGLAARP
jgi:hypothetical protein